MIIYTFEKSNTHAVILGTDTNTHNYRIIKKETGYYQVLDNDIVVGKILATMDGMQRFTGKWSWEFISADAKKAGYGCRIQNNAFYGKTGCTDAITAFAKVYEQFCKNFSEQRQLA